VRGPTEPKKEVEERTMWASLRRVPAFVLTSILLTGLAYAGDGGGQGPSARGPIFDITHFDVLPVNLYHNLLG
jgi:hypothetical protein